MNKLLSFLLIFSILFTMPTVILASDASEQVQYEYFEDGSYMISIIFENITDGLSLQQ